MNAIALETQDKTEDIAETPMVEKGPSPEIVEQYEKSAYKQSFEKLENIPEITKKAVEWLALEADIPENEREALIGSNTSTKFYQHPNKPAEDQEFLFNGRIQIPLDPVETINRERGNEAFSGYYEVLAERLGVDVEKVLDEDIVPAELLVTFYTFHELRHRIKVRVEYAKELERSGETERLNRRYRGMHEPDVRNGGSIFEIAKRGRTPDITDERWEEVVRKMNAYTKDYKRTEKETDADEWAVKQLAGFIQAQKEEVEDVEL